MDVKILIGVFSLFFCILKRILHFTLFRLFKPAQVAVERWQELFQEL